MSRLEPQQDVDDASRSRQTASTTSTNGRSKPRFHVFRKRRQPLSDEQRQGPEDPTRRSSQQDVSEQNSSSQDQLQRTAVFTSIQSHPQATHNKALFHKEPRHYPSAKESIPETPAVESNDTTAVVKKTSCSSATAIFQHSLCVCGGEIDDALENDMDNVDQRLGQHHLHSHSHHDFPHLPEDPTVQESIECVFAYQLEQGLPHFLWQESDDEPSTDHQPLNHSSIMPSPAGILQSRQAGRHPNDLEMLPLPHTKPQQSRAQDAHSKADLGRLVHMGTYDPTLQKLIAPTSSTRIRRTLRPTESSLYQDYSATMDTTMAPSTSKPDVVHYSVCCHKCQGNLRTPIVVPKDWPQRPLLLRPTPGSGMRVLGIRYASGEYLWKPTHSSHHHDSKSKALWYQKLARQWNFPSHFNQSIPQEEDTCAECMILPINNGNEAPGKSLLADFESPLFRGTILVRLRHAEGTTERPYNDDEGYFCGMHRRYQIVIRGKFREAVNWTDLTAGMELERPCGKLPPKWILKSALKVVSFFAPQLQARLDGAHPTSLTPLGSTPQSLRVEEEAGSDMEAMQEEPRDASKTLLGHASGAPSTLQRARARKRAFDKLFVQESNWPVTDPSKVYTFEFLQHMLNVEEFSIELGSVLGKIELEDSLDGQPLPIMAKHQDGRRLWAFDIWHECLVDDAIRHDKMKLQRGA